MRRPLLVIGLTAIVLLVLALMWGRWDPVEPARNVDRQPEAAVSQSEQPTESASTASTDATDDLNPLWTQVDESTMAVLPPYANEWSPEGRVLVEVSAIDWLWSAQAGDRLALPVPQLGTTFRSVVDEIDEDVGARALVGTITGSDGYRRRSVVTIGPTSLFAFIDTPNGTYEFAIDLALHQHGWLVPTSSMLAGWDFSKPDYFINRDGDAGTDADSGASR
ncbi:MAG: hypothetical protein OXH45_01855 [Gammaproteobacteria bacterium]|nr:hypothetical protein [Gammaproteobacteria bacterium]